MTLPSLLTAAILAAQGVTAPAAGATSAEPESARAPVDQPKAIASVEEARTLCQALTPAERLPLTGDAVERGEAGPSHEAAAEAALGGRYRITVPAEQLRFAPYDPEAGRLSLFRHALPTSAEGAVRLRPVEEEGLPVDVDVASARRILKAQADRTLALEVVFVLPDDDDAPCFAVPGATTHTLAAEPVAWEYVAGGAVLARGGQLAHRPVVSAAEGARPRVELGRAIVAGGGLTDLPASRGPELERCYAEALKRDPWLDGAIVADVGAGPLRIAADSVQDEGLRSCVSGVLARVDVRGRTLVPIHFTLEPPATASATQ